MATRTCLGCGVELTGEVATLEHVLPRWLASEIERPEVSLNHFLHNEEKAEDTLLRSYGLSTFTTKKLCCGCNNGWMSRLESQAKPHILGLMNQKTHLLSLTDDARRTLSRWAAKTAFMIWLSRRFSFNFLGTFFKGLGRRRTTAQMGVWSLRVSSPTYLKASYTHVPQMAFPKETLFRCAWASQFTICTSWLSFQLCMVRIAAGIHVPLWPLGVNVLAGYKPCPNSFDTPNRFLDFLTNLVEVGVIEKKNMVRLELDPSSDTAVAV